MRDGRFYDIGWHMDYHSQKKKRKAADCVFLDTNRICNNYESWNYLAKCFDASHCPIRKREAEEKERNKKIEGTKPKDPQERNNRSTTSNSKASKENKTEVHNKKCSIPLGTVVEHKEYGRGEFISFDAKKGYIKIRFNNIDVEFDYYIAFRRRTLKVSDEVMALVQSDLK